MWIQCTGSTDPVTLALLSLPLRKHAYSNILRILPPKNENFQIKNSGSFPISAQNIDCGYLLEPPLRGGSNEYPQSMFFFLAEIGKLIFTPVSGAGVGEWGVTSYILHSMDVRAEYSPFSALPGI